MDSPLCELRHWRARLLDGRFVDWSRGRTLQRQCRALGLRDAAVDELDDPATVVGCVWRGLYTLAWEGGRRAAEARNVDALRWMIRTRTFGQAEDTVVWFYDAGWTDGLELLLPHVVKRIQTPTILRALRDLGIASITRIVHPKLFFFTPSCSSSPTTERGPPLRPSSPEASGTPDRQPAAPRL